MGLGERQVGWSFDGREALDRLGPPTVVLVVLLGAWEGYVTLSRTPPVILPGPVDVGGALVVHWSVLLEAAGITAVTAFGGLVGGLVVGFPIAYATSRSRSVASFVLPYVVALRIAPLVAIAPLLVLWLGEGVFARVVLVTTMTVFPVVIASYDGLRTVPRGYVDLANSVAVPDRRIFIRVELPAAAPSVLAGVKLAAALSVVGAVVAEFVTLESGLGFQLFEASRSLETPLMFAALVTLAALGVVFYGTPVLFARYSRWARVS